MEFELSPVLKALHIISMVAWMAGLLYLPRLFVYHADKAVGSEASEMLKIMERKLLRYIATPAMIATLTFGVWLAVKDGWLEPGVGKWLHIKIGFVFLMAGFHGMVAKWFTDFKNDRNTKSAKFFRLVNEIPAVFLIIIVFLVVLKEPV